MAVQAYGPATYDGKGLPTESATLRVEDDELPEPEDEDAGPRAEPGFPSDVQEEAAEQVPTLVRWNKSRGPSFRLSPGGPLLSSSSGRFDLGKKAADEFAAPPPADALTAPLPEDLEPEAVPLVRAPLSCRPLACSADTPTPPATVTSPPAPRSAQIAPAVPSTVTPFSPAGLGAPPGKASRLCNVSRSLAAADAGAHEGPVTMHGEVQGAKSDAQLVSPPVAFGNQVAPAPPAATVGVVGVGVGLGVPASDAAKLELAELLVANERAKARTGKDLLELIGVAAIAPGQAAAKQSNRLVRAVQALVAHPDFELAVILLIGANCLTLALYRPMLGDGAAWNRNLDTAELALNAAFSLEMLLRLLYHGSLTQYLAQPWNIFDFLMVFAGYTSFLPVQSSTQSLRALRALRALRPLRTISRFPSLRVVVVAFIDSLPVLGNVSATIVFVLLLFAISSLSLFQSAYHHQCYDPATGQYELSSGPSPDEFGCGRRKCPADFPVCQYRTVGRGQATSGFDNLGTAFLSVFQVWLRQMALGLTSQQLVER